jgi:epsin
MQPASGAGFDNQSGVPLQNGAPSYIPSQTSQFTAPANQQPSQPSFLPQIGTSAPQPALISRGASQPLGVPNSAPSAASFPLHTSSSAPPETLISALQVSQTEPVKKFEPKSKLWSDTLSRGIVNLDISGCKWLVMVSLFLQCQQPTFVLSDLIAYVLQQKQTLMLILELTSIQSIARRKGKKRK